jgi:hypothetical protein
MDETKTIQLLETDVYHSPSMVTDTKIGDVPIIGCTGTNRIFFKKADGSDTCFLDIEGSDSTKDVTMRHGDDCFYFVRNDSVVSTSRAFPEGDWVWDKDSTIISDTSCWIVFYDYLMPVTPKPTVVKFSDLLPPTSSESASDYQFTAQITDRLELSFKWARPTASG